MLLILFPVVLLIIYKYLTINFEYWKKRNVIYEKPIPIFGNIMKPLLFKETIGDCLRNLYEKHKEEPYLGIFILGKPGLLINDPELIKSVLVKDFQYFQDRTTTSDESIDPVSANILFNAKSPHWNALRRTVNPIFSSGKLKNMHILIQECAADMVYYLKSNESINIEFAEVLSKYTTDVITSTCFGINANCFKDESSKFRQISKKIFDWNSFEIYIPIMSYFVAPTIVKLFRLKFINSDCSKFLREAFSYAMSEREKTGTNRNDLLDILLQNKNKQHGDIVLDDEKAFAQAIQFFAAGFEPTSGTLTFCLYELAKNPEIQKNLVNEIVETKAKYTEFSYDVLKEMKYLKMCIYETLRKYPNLPFLDRRCKEDYALSGTKVVIEKGTPIFIALLGLHYDPRYFPDPDKFVPERFKEADMKCFHYLPFGNGPRKCVGYKFGMLTMKIGLVHLLSNFEINICDKTHLVLQRRGFLLNVKDGLILKLTQRENY